MSCFADVEHLEGYKEWIVCFSLMSSQWGWMKINHLPEIFYLASLLAIRSHILNIYSWVCLWCSCSVFYTFLTYWLYPLMGVIVSRQESLGCILITSKLPAVFPLKMCKCDVTPFHCFLQLYILLKIASLWEVPVCLWSVSQRLECFLFLFLIQAQPKFRSLSHRKC